MVELFFAISGFGIMMGYYDRIADGLTFKDYILGKVRKIYPFFLYSTFFTIIFEVFYIVKMRDTFIYPIFDIYHLVLNLLFLQDGYFGTEWSFDSPSWYLGVVFFGMRCFII